MNAVSPTGRGHVCLCPVGGPAHCTVATRCQADRKICQAVLTKGVIEFDYDDIHRVVEPHYYGLTSRNKQAIRGYQTNCGGVRSPEPDWHLFSQDKVVGLRLTQGHFREARAGYNPDDSQMHGYFARFE